MSISKGFGERALPLVLQMSHKFEMDVSGYEKLVAPPVVFPDEAATYGINLNRDGLIFASEGNVDVPKYLQFPLSIGNVTSMDEYIVNKLKETLLADMFDLINKVNMPTPEVESRNVNGLRKGFLYTSKDEEDNLEPTSEYLNFQITHHYGDEDLQDVLLKAQYTSPLSRSHMESRFEKLDRAMLSIVNLGKAEGANPKAKAVLKSYDAIKKILQSHNMEDIIYDEEEINANITQDKERVLTEDETGRERQITATLDNAIKEQQLASGGERQPREGQENQAGGESSPPV